MHRMMPLAALGLTAVAAQLTEQCHFVRFSDGTASEPIAYTARCSRTPGGAVDVCSRLNLSHCLANEDGRLAIPIDATSASFKETCPSCHVDGDGVLLSCLCRRTESEYSCYTSINLSSIILVQQGVLACSTTAGQELTECPVSRMGTPPRRRRFVG